MRAKAGDPPRTMAQKILAGRAADPRLEGEQVTVKVDQVALVRAPHRALAEAREAGLKKSPVEVGVVYDGLCVGGPGDPPASLLAAEAARAGLVTARAGIGFPAPVHLERFASPARLCVTDDARLAGVGGIGMLALVVSPGQLAQALAQGSIVVRPPRSIQVVLSGRMRPFVCARDVALELFRRGLADTVRKVDAAHGAPVVLEFTGPSARLLSVGERAVLAALAPQVGAAGALFVSDERTEVFLRDQRRSKAHRALVPDAGAPSDEVVQVDLGAVDPLLLDDTGVVRSVRDLAGKPVSQVLVGGDTGVTLRDMFAVAALLKSKKVPPRVEFLLAMPSRQMLEVLSQAGALTDLIATGGRLVEPDARVMRGGLYPVAEGSLGLRTSDAEPSGGGFVVASAETAAYAVATGEIGDPRSFKRPVRVTIPRVLPTDDVLVAREKKVPESAAAKLAAALPVPSPWKGAATLDVLERPTALAGLAPGRLVAVVCATLDEVRDVVGRAPESACLRAVVAPFVPASSVAVLAGLGVAVLGVDASAIKTLRAAKALTVPAPAATGGAAAATLTAGTTKIEARWLAVGSERSWTSFGTSRPAPAARKSSAQLG